MFWFCSTQRWHHTNYYYVRVRRRGLTASLQRIFTACAATTQLVGACVRVSMRVCVCVSESRCVGAGAGSGTGYAPYGVDFLVLTGFASGMACVHISRSGGLNYVQALCACDGSARTWWRVDVQTSGGWFWGGGGVLKCVRSCGEVASDGLLFGTVNISKHTHSLPQFITYLHVDSVPAVRIQCGVVPRV